MKSNVLHINHNGFVGGHTVHSTIIRFSEIKYDWIQLSNHTLLSFSIGESIEYNRDGETRKLIVEKIENLIDRKSDDETEIYIQRIVHCKEIE